MDTIERLHLTLLKPYSRSIGAGPTIASAKALARMILSNDELLVEHQKKMLTEVLWLLSSADGKHKTRFRSAEVLRLSQHEPQSQVKVQHEHVFPRKAVIAKLLARQTQLRVNPSELDRMLDETVGCIVTADEHRLLLEGHGWARYAGITVMDMAQTPPAPWRP